ncbi:MAG TPA: VOC family protein [Candidatus Limnocylindria bacterium]|nr:VOC family protein [Candidatus Limnocylindria bacterium]
MTTDTAIPALPCVTLEESLPFYRLLGCEVTYKQKTPNPYAVVARGDVQLHLFGIPRLDPAAAYSTCLIIVAEVEDLHELFATALRTAYGKLPIAGIPRITRMRMGQSRFTIVDPAGNSLIFIRRAGSDATEDGYEDGPVAEAESKLALAIRTAARLRDFKTDDAMAAKVLDAALAKSATAAPAERARALAARAEIAVALGETERAHALMVELRQVQLSDAERDELREELDAADKLERSQT